jgi:hypothetical protein
MKTFFAIQTHRRRAIESMANDAPKLAAAAAEAAEALLDQMPKSAELPTLCRESAQEARAAASAAEGKLPWCVRLERRKEYIFIRVYLNGHYFCSHGTFEDEATALVAAGALWEGVISALNRAGITSAPANLESTAA